MNPISAIFFLLTLLIIFLAFRAESDFLSPGKMFILVWTLVIGLTNLKLSMFQKEWSLEIWIHILIGPVSFLTGIFISYVINFEKSILKISDIRRKLIHINVDSSKLFVIVCVLFLLFIISYVAILFKAGTIPVIADKPWEVRREFTIFGLGLFLHNVFLIVLLSSVYILFEKEKKVQRYFLIFLSLVSIVLYSATLQRYQIILTIFVIIVVLYYTTNKINIKSVLITGLFLIGFFYLISTFRLGELVLYIMYRISKMKFSPEYAIFTEPYMYVSMNLENFAHSITKLTNFSYGYFTFDFITAVTGLKHWLQEYFNLVENPSLISISFNTYSAFWTYYRDFGILGIFIIPMVGGLTIGSLYYSFKQNPSISKLSFYAIFLYGVVFSFFNSVFGFLWFIYNIIALWYVFRYLKLN